MRNKWLITGATGHVGQALIQQAQQMPSPPELLFATRQPPDALPTHATHVPFDFAEPASVDTAIAQADIVFLLRPPQLADVDRYFQPVVKALQRHQKPVVFLSVQGAERSKVIPHNKIERLIEAHGVPHVFLRPSYFMQNLTSTLGSDIVQHRKIVLPSGQATFNWIHVDDIGAVAATVMANFDRHAGKKLVLTGQENLSFGEVVQRWNAYLDEPVKYQSVNPFRFCFYQRKQGMAQGFIIVMLLLHFLPRFQQEPEITATIQDLLQRSPKRLDDFLQDTARRLHQR